jgi:hypothetical protein
MKLVIAKIIILALAVLIQPAYAEESVQAATEAGEGGAGGDGAVLRPPEISKEKFEAFEKSLTPAQNKLLDEMIALDYAARPQYLEQAKKYYQSTGVTINGVEDIVKLVRTEQLKWIATAPTEQQKEIWNKLPSEIIQARKRADPAYVTDSERAAADEAPASIKEAVKALAGDDVEAFINARHTVVEHGPAASALVADLLKTLDKQSYKRIRLLSVLQEVQEDTRSNRAKVLRIADAAFKRRDELQAAAPAAKFAVLLSRGALSYGARRNELPVYDKQCYFSFPRDANGYDGAVSLEFDNSANELSVTMYGGQQNKINDLGPVDFATIKSAPNIEATRKWKERVVAAVGHVYMEHCLEPRDQIDACFKFKVLELKASQYVIIEWAPIPQDK